VQEENSNMKGIQNIRSTAIPLPVENIDTDQIIPARFLKATSRDGFGKNLFRDWRYNNDDEAQPKKDFVLNESRYNGSVLIAGKNFGCGSSREHAAWAIKDFGFDVVISSFFADIFRNNALNNFLLPIQVSEEVLQQLLKAVFENPDTAFEVDVAAQSLTVPSLSLTVPFELNQYKKTCLLNGFDDIDYLLSIREEIETFEQHKH
jgi:3-isopropylmalate/(R)-2-methylmalate dehydratase small subunit